MALLMMWAEAFAVWSEDHLQQSHLGADLQCRFLGTIPGFELILGWRGSITCISASPSPDSYAHLNMNTGQEADHLPRCSGLPFKIVIRKPKPSAAWVPESKVTLNWFSEAHFVIFQVPSSPYSYKLFLKGCPARADPLTVTNCEHL